MFNYSVRDALKLYSALQGNADYMGELQKIAKTNPQIAKAMEIVNNNGGDQKAAFMALAKQVGIDPNMVINLINKGVTAHTLL